MIALPNNTPYGVMHPLSPYSLTSPTIPTLIETLSQYLILLHGLNGHMLHIFYPRSSDIIIKSKGHNIELTYAPCLFGGVSFSFVSTDGVTVHYDSIMNHEMEPLPYLPSDHMFIKRNHY